VPNLHLWSDWYWLRRRLLVFVDVTVSTEAGEPRTALTGPLETQTPVGCKLELRDILHEALEHDVIPVSNVLEDLTETLVDDSVHLLIEDSNDTLLHST
jgi:hypothetical protein